jgi:hypothetical protein
MLAAGESFGDYEVLELIGSGAAISHDQTGSPGRDAIADGRAQLVRRAEARRAAARFAPLVA